MPHLKQSQHSCQHWASSAALSTTNWPSNAAAANGPRLLYDADATFGSYHPNGFIGQCEYTESQAWRVSSYQTSNAGIDQKERTIGFHKSTVQEDNTNQYKTSSTIRLLDPHEIHIGDRVRIHSQKANGKGGWFQTRTVDSLVRVQGGPGEGHHGLIKYIHVDAPIEDGGITNFESIDDGFQVFVDQRGSTEEAECSNRGLCDQSTGLCECFKGYTDDDCSRQNALSAGGSA